MPDILIEQALYLRPDFEAPRLLARSEGFRDDWLEEANGLIVGFGDRPAGMKSVEAVFAHPLAIDQVAVVHMADQDEGGTARPVAGFHLLIVPRRDYERFLNDPFALARLLPAHWKDWGTLSTLTLPAQPLPVRKVQDIQRVLKRVKAGALHEGQDPENEPVRTAENSESPALLGGAQILVDGGKIVFERPAADSGLIPALWTLLPTSTRSQLWPASFAFGNALGFDALVVARANGAEFQEYTHEDQAADYPQGRYELNLQIAAEADDQRALDLLLNRRSWVESWRLGLTLLAMFLFLALAARVMDVFAPPPGREADRLPARAMVAASMVGMSDTFNTLGILPAAREAWSKIDEDGP